IYAASHWLAGRGDQWRATIRGAHLFAATLTMGGLITCLGAWLVSFLIGSFMFEPNLLGVMALVATSAACLLGWLLEPETRETSLRSFFSAVFLVPLPAAV